MIEVCNDFYDEVTELKQFLKNLKEEDWHKETGFNQWTPWDIVAHLHFYDEFSLIALRGGDAFDYAKEEILKDYKEGKSNQMIARLKYSDLGGNELLKKWEKTAFKLSKSLGERDVKMRIPWFGPDMGVQMFVTARYMETWAHSQAIYDLLKIKRHHTDRIKNVVVIGLKTFSWTFNNRKMDLPGEVPYLKLLSPSGEIWEWNEENETSSIIGSAIDFCQVVTQVRNINDTNLTLIGEAALKWMEIAQCFAGPPVDPPKVGKRRLGG